jgi:hypothetical protein
MAVTNDYELEFAGLLFGGETDYGFVRAEGLADNPEVRSSDQTRLRRHGMIPGDDFVGGRSVVIDLEVFGDTTTAFATNLTALKTAFAPGSAEQALSFKVPGVAGGGTRLLYARSRKLALPLETSFYFGMPIASVEFFATDPRIYDTSQQAPSTGLTASVAGRPSGNFVWNLTWGGASTSNIIVANNVGSFTTPCVIRFDGPVTNPQVENVTQGKLLKLTADGGITLAAGEFLEIDTDARTILLGGTSSRYSKLSSDSAWFDLAPGLNSLRFIGTTAGAPTMTVSWRSAWL